jgi:hypothetical protein
MSSLARFAAHEITPGDTAALQSACDVGLYLSENMSSEHLAGMASGESRRELLGVLLFACRR